MFQPQIPSLHFRSEANFPSLQALERIYAPPSSDFIYSARYSYVARPIQENIAILEDLFLKVPSARESVLHVISTMCHECITMVFLKRERKINNSNAAEMELEICKFFGRLPIILERLNSKKLHFFVLKWAFSLCADIAKYNTKRATVQLARDIIPFFMNFQSINALLTFLNSLLTLLMTDHADEVVSITVDCFRYDTDFDWIFLHVVTNFSFHFTPRLLSICIDEMRKRREAFLQEREIQKSDQFVVISDLMQFLSGRNSPFLHASLFEHISGFFSGSKPIQSLYCVANLFFQNQEVAKSVADDVHQLIIQRNLVLLIKLVFDTEWTVAQLHPATGKMMNAPAATVKMLKILPLDTLILLYNSMSPILCGTRSINEFLKFDAPRFLDACEKLNKFMDDTFTIILMKLLTNPNASFETLPHLEQITTSNVKFKQLSHDVLEGNSRAKYSSKLLVVCCLVGQEQFAVKVLCQLLYNAKSDLEMKNFVAFAHVLKPHFVQCISHCIVHLINNLKEFDDDFRLENPNVLVNLNFMKNLATISEWHATAKNKQTEMDLFCSVNFSFVDGHLQSKFLDFMIGILERLILVENLANGYAAEIVVEWIGYMSRLELIDFHSMSYDILIQLIEKFATIGVLLIRILPATIKDEALVLGVCKTYFKFCKSFLCKNSSTDSEQKIQLLRWCLSNFMRSFLLNIFDMAHELFGTSQGLFESFEQLAFDDIPTQLLPKISCSDLIPDMNLTCLERLRLRPFVQRKTSTLAHSGKISDKHTKFVQKKWDSVENLRCSIIVGFCSDFCLDFNGCLPNFENQISCLIGKLLTELVCPDALTSTISWLDWSIERECVPLYTEVTNKIRSFPLIYDLLLKLGQNGFVSMCSALPLIKSMFAVITNFHGATPKKFDTLNTTQLEDIARLLSLFFSSGLLPIQYKSLFELFKMTTHHETYLTLNSLWEYIRLTVPQSVDELQALCNMEIPAVEFTRKANPQLLTIILTPIIQQHIEELGYLLPNFLSEEDTENLENQVW